MHTLESRPTSFFHSFEIRIIECEHNRNHMITSCVFFLSFLGLFCLWDFSGAILKNKLSHYFISTCIGFKKHIDIFFIEFFSIIHYSLKSDYSLFINFFFYSLKIIGLFIIFRPSLFTIHYFFGSLFTIHHKIRPLFTNHYTPSRPSSE